MPFKEDLIALIKSPESGIESPQFDIEESSAGKIAGFVVSRTFGGMPQIDRQNLLWNYLDRVCPRERGRKIVSLVTVTPDEMADD